MFEILLPAAGGGEAAHLRAVPDGALAGSDLRVKNSWGLAAHVGGDYWISDRAAIRADLRWIDIDADVELNGAKIGKVEVDPVVAGISYVMKF
mgnify:CR=1 FL=1